MNHTKEPWKVLCWNDGTFGIYDKNDDSICHFNQFENHEDADRIVACVNACIEVPNEKLESISVLETLVHHDKQDEKINKLTFKNAELLKQLELLIGISSEIDAIERCESWKGGEPEYGTVITFGKIKQKIEKAHAAIAKMETDK